jgi:hypothetical protein
VTLFLSVFHRNPSRIEKTIIRKNISKHCNMRLRRSAMVLNTGITCYSPVLIAGLELRGLVQFLRQPGLPEGQRIHSCAKGRGQEAAKQKRDASRQADQTMGG